MSAVEVVQRLVFEGGLAWKEVGELELWEVHALLPGLYMSRQATWEAARLGAYVTAQVNSKKKLTPQSVMRFPWEQGRSAEGAESSASDLEGLIGLG